jgi:hypothetical protein
MRVLLGPESSRASFASGNTLLQARVSAKRDVCADMIEAG